MPDSPAITTRVLFVDDDTSFLGMIRDLFGNASGGAWDIQTASGANEGFQILRRMKVDIAIIDVHMPGMDGLQMLRVLNEEFPSLPKVMLTGMPDDNTRAAALENGAALFLEKPSNAAGYESVFATIKELLRWHERYSSRGSLRSLSLLDLVKLECKSENSRLFEVFVGEVRGEIYVKEGSIVHAIMPDRRGQSAFTFLATSPGAVFYLRQFVEPVERSITRQWEFLVMEATQMAEQVAQRPDPNPKLVITPPAMPATPAEISSPPLLRMAAPAAVTIAPTSRTAAPSDATAPAVKLPDTARFVRPFVPQATPPTELETLAAPEWKISDAPDARAMEFEADAAGFKVEEMLLCAEFREVLFESQCVDPAKRMHFGETLLQKANELSRSLPLGELERAELQSSGSRLVLKFEAKRCLFVRTNSKARPPVTDTATTHKPADWLAQLAQIRGLLGASVITLDNQVHKRSFAKDYQEEVLQAAAREAARLLDVSMRFMFPAWQVRLLYSRCQIYTLRRQDGMVLNAFLLRDGHDTAAMQRFFEEFRQVKA